MWILKTAALTRGWSLFEARRLLEKIRHFILYENQVAKHQI